MLEGKILQRMSDKQEAAKTSFFLFINKKLPHPEETMESLYDKYRD